MGRAGPRIDAEGRRQVREARVEDNRAKLERLDLEAAARLKPGDTARIARALEVICRPATFASGRTQKRGGIAGHIV